MQLATLGMLYIGGGHDLLPVLGWNEYPGTQIAILPWGTLMASVYGLVIAFSVLSNQWLDVRVSLSREMATGLRLFFLVAIVLVLLAPLGVLFPATFDGGVILATVCVVGVAALLTSALFPRLLGGVSERWSHLVLGDRFEYQDRIASLIDEMPFFENRTEMVRRTAELVFASMQLTSCGIHLLPSTHASTETHWLNRKQVVPPTELWQQTSPLWAYFHRTKRSVIACAPDDGAPDPDNGIQALLRAHGALTVKAIGLRDGNPIGLLLIGPRHDGRSLTQLDFDLFTRITRNLAAQAERLELHQADDLRQAGRAKDQFLASVNHEIRNPLNGIVGLARMLDDTGVDARQRFLVSTLRGCADQLQSILDDVLDFRVVEEQTVILRPAPVDLVLLVRSVCASHDPTGERIRIEIADPLTAIWARVDAGKLRQMIANFLTNALKYGVPPGGTVSLLTKQELDGRLRIHLSVTSTGPTLDSSELAQLFLPLSRGRRARETNAHGMGLGLALVRRLAEAMGGKTDTSSVNGQTEFGFEIVAEAAAPADGIPQAVTEDFRGVQILAIEDEPYNRLVLHHILDRLGATTTWAETAASAVRHAMSTRFDFILMDWFLPDMTGPDLLAALRRQSIQPAPPFVVVTAYSTTAKRAECINAGARAFVSKPVDVIKLVEALRFATGSATVPSSRSVPSTAKNWNESDLGHLLTDPAEIQHFHESIDRQHESLVELWRTTPDQAALIAHRLKSLCRLSGNRPASETFGSIETALRESWGADSIASLITESIQVRRPHEETTSLSAEFTTSANRHESQCP